MCLARILLLLLAVNAIAFPFVMPELSVHDMFKKRPIGTEKGIRSDLSEKEVSSIITTASRHNKLREEAAKAKALAATLVCRCNQIIGRGALAETCG